jgi:hypothetical protein
MDGATFSEQGKNRVVTSHKKSRSRLQNRISQDETISSKGMLEGKFEQRVRPKTAAIKCKVETG